MDFDNYAHESSYGGHDPGMYSSDPYGQSYSPHLPNGGQYYQDSGPLMDHESPSTVAVVTETCPEW